MAPVQEEKEKENDAASVTLRIKAMEKKSSFRTSGAKEAKFVVIAVPGSDQPAIKKIAKAAALLPSPCEDSHPRTPQRQQDVHEKIRSLNKAVAHEVYSSPGVDALRRSQRKKKIANDMFGQTRKAPALQQVKAPPSTMLPPPPLSSSSLLSSFMVKFPAEKARKGLQ